MAHLITKKIFDLNYYQPGKAVKVRVEDTESHALIKEATEEELIIVQFKDSIGVDDQFEYTLSEDTISVSDVENGEFEITRLEDKTTMNTDSPIVVSKSICNQLFQMYRGLSNEYTEQQKLLDEQAGKDDHTAIYEADEIRTVKFTRLMKGLLDDAAKKQDQSGQET